MISEPKLLTLPVTHTGDPLIVAEGSNIPFEVKRAFWISSVKRGKIKGEHAHKNSQQLLICINGSLKITLENIHGKKFYYLLSKPNEAVYIPPQFWGKIEYLTNSTILALASDEYDEQDYIRDYTTFKSQ